jgi:hypothetical protein
MTGFAADRRYAFSKAFTPHMEVRHFLMGARDSQAAARREDRGTGCPAAWPDAAKSACRWGTRVSGPA